MTTRISGERRWIASAMILKHFWAPPVFRVFQILLSGSAALAIAACSSLGASGPGANAVKGAAQRNVDGAKIAIVNLDSVVVRHMIERGRALGFAEIFGDVAAVGSMVGNGDVLDVAIWESPPAALFGTAVPDARLSSVGSSLRAATIPEQMVRSDGMITVPFAGDIRASGRTLSQIEREIAARLTGLANRPQIVVRLVRNSAANVTIVGDVASSTRMPLTSKGERLLDALASAGGGKQPVGKTTIQLARQGRVATLPLDVIIRDPRQNIRLSADDVVTAFFQPYSFTSLGAVGQNAEIPFEGTGLTLAQALGRIGGLRDDRADIRGVFIFRFEQPSALEPAQLVGTQLTPDGRVPVIYRVDLANAANFFTAQNFPIKDRDVIYVSNAPIADIQKFVNIISSTAFSLVNVGNSF